MKNLDGFDDLFSNVDFLFLSGLVFFLFGFLFSFFSILPVYDCVGGGYEKCKYYYLLSIDEMSFNIIPKTSCPSYPPFSCIF